MIWIMRIAAKYRPLAVAVRFAQWRFGRSVKAAELWSAWEGRLRRRARGVR